MSWSLHRTVARLAAGGCSAALALWLGFSPSTAWANKAFASPEAAMNAFGDAVASSDEDSLKDLLGANFRQLIPPIGAEDRYRFLAAWAQSHKVQEGPDGKTAIIAAGNDGWTLPIPLVKSAPGWRFDTAAGIEKMRERRIGRNELAVIQTMLAIYDAQREYASEPRDRDGLRKYATKLTSSPGKHDGLYWSTRPDEQPSPLGPILAAAGPPNASADGYYGYHYKLLTAQGTHATGGALDYMVHGKLLGGFAVMAWPARYWDTGVMSFIVSHDGQVYERDLGPEGAEKAAATKAFDPGPGWEKVSP
jgi:hypothetical protein